MEENREIPDWGLSPEVRRDLILSLGTHQGARRLAPLEVAEYFQVAINAGRSFEQLAQLVGLESTSTIREIHRLLKLAPSLRHLVGWGRQADSMLTMTAATYLARIVNHSEQESAARMIVEAQLSSGEVRQLVERRIKSGQSLEDSMQSILRQRPRITRRHFVVGAIVSEEMRKVLATKSQLERDTLLCSILKEKFPRLDWSQAKMGVDRFSIYGDESFKQELDHIGPDFEEHISNYAEQMLA
jgi:hypothetical protein